MGKLILVHLSDVAETRLINTDLIAIVEERSNGSLIITNGLHIATYLYVTESPNELLSAANNDIEKVPTACITNSSVVNLVSAVEAYLENGSPKHHLAVADALHIVKSLLHK